MKYFHNVDCIEELKAQYRKLAMKHHPDVGGDTMTMQEINEEYSALFERYKDIHAGTNKETGKRETYKAYKETTEAPADFINIINRLIVLDGVTVELCGKWIWCSGDTRKHKETLKDLGFRWSSKKTAWYYHRPEDAAMKYKNRKEWDMNRIREFWGSEIYAEQQNGGNWRKNTAEIA